LSLLFPAEIQLTNFEHLFISQKPLDDHFLLIARNPDLQETSVGQCRSLPHQCRRVRKLRAVDGKNDIAFSQPALAKAESAGSSKTKTPVTPGRPNADISPSSVWLDLGADILFAR